MLSDKWILKSKTVIAAILGMLVIGLPMVGFSFSSEDSALFTEFYDKIIELALLGTVIFGRFTATKTVTLT